MSTMRRAFSDAFTFGRSSTGKVEKRFAECLPAADWPVYDDNGDLKGFNGWHVFGSETARNHFIKHALILLSVNGKNDLSNLHFDNFFARSYDKAGVIWYTASIVVTATGDYRVRHSIVSTRAGTTKTAAFQLLMLDVETKLDAVLRGNGLNSGGLPGQHVKGKESMSTVSIIATPSEAMAAPELKNDDCNTWSGAPLTKSPKSKASTHFSHSSKASESTQKSFASSKYSQASQSSQSTAPSIHLGSESSKVLHQSSLPSSTSTAPAPKHVQHARHASTPLHPATITTPPIPKAAKHTSQPLQTRPVRSTSTPPTPTIFKVLPPLPRSSTEHLPVPAEPLQLHPALRSKSNSAEGLRPKVPSIASSSIYSRSPVSPLDELEKEMRPLHVDADVPSPLHFEKPIARIPARLLRQQTEFEIYV